MGFAFGLLVLIFVPVAFVLSVRKYARGSFGRRAVTVLWVAAASLIAGIYGLLRAWERTDILDSASMIETSAIFGLSALLPFAFFSLYLLGRSWRAWLVLLAGLLVALPGFFLFAYALMREANIHLDAGTARIYELRGVSPKHVETDSPLPRNASYYILDTREWPPDLPWPPQLRIRPDEYHALLAKNRALLFVRPGALGYAWVERVLPTPTVE
ncbi:MAG TPA: hypothetical protein VGD45_29150 [Steroidobacter sp.]|uniref:hypothetical protein n=1 Tax=Steroidobacter sp. TaxID=1978227 RepID=UPI002ED9EDEA